MLFEKLGRHIKCLEALLCPRISYFLQSLTTCLYTGNTSRKFAKEDCLHPLDEFQVSFSSWARSETCSLVLRSFLKTSLCQKEGDAVKMAGFISDLTISVCFPLTGTEWGKLASPSLPEAVRCNSFHSVLNLNQDVTQEASPACQFNEFYL